MFHVKHCGVCRTSLFTNSRYSSGLRSPQLNNTYLIEVILGLLLTQLRQPLDLSRCIKRNLLSIP